MYQTFFCARAASFTAFEAILLIQEVHYENMLIIMIITKLSFDE
jgi:hypothetical protein